MVRSGGRSRDIHIPTMNARKTAMPAAVQETAAFRLPFHAKKAPAVHSRTAGSANHANKCQLIVIPPF